MRFVEIRHISAKKADDRAYQVALLKRHLLYGWQGSFRVSAVEGGHAIVHFTDIFIIIKIITNTFAFAFGSRCTKAPWTYRSVHKATRLLYARACRHESEVKYIKRVKNVVKIRVFT